MTHPAGIPSPAEIHKAALDAAVTVGIVGCGTMGVGIAQVALTAGHPVVLYDVDPDRSALAVQTITEAIQRRAERGQLTETTRHEAVLRLSLAAEVDQLSDCGLVIEAAAEDLSVKQAIFRRLEQVCRDDAILATNTSSLSITALAAALRDPGRVVGMHFFNPAPSMRLVEVVSGAATNAKVAEKVAATAMAWGKTVVPVRSTPGFVVNRVARPFYGEALRVLAEHAADPATIDAVLRGAGGFRMGPFELMDLIGVDVNLAVTRSIWTAFHHDPRYTPALAQEELVAAGLTGRKSEQGFFDYREGAAVALPSTEPDRPLPSTARVGAPGALPEALLTRLDAAGVEVIRATDSGSGIELADGGVLRLTDGRTASDVAMDLGHAVVVLDLALDATTADRCAVAASDGCPDAVLDAAVGLLQATGAAVSVLDDAPGLVVARTVAMLVNEAADVVLTGVASAADVDLAMTLGVNYPLGPLAWGDRWGAAAVVTLLDHLIATYGDGRYRCSPWLRRRAFQNLPLTAPPVP